jgi:hypothetical protein
MTEDLTYLNDEERVSELLENNVIKYANLTEDGARIATNDGRAYMIGQRGINGLRTPSDERTIGSLTGGDIFAQLRNETPFIAGYKSEKRPY